MGMIARAVMIGLLLLGAAVLAVAIRGDPSRGRRRCPKCWYDLQLPLDAEGQLTCPECGKLSKGEHRLLRTRRSRRGILVSAVLMSGAGGAFLVARITDQGWSALPRTVVLMAPQVWDLQQSSSRRGLSSALHRAAAVKLPAWQQRMLRSVIDRNLVSADAGERSVAVSLFLQAHEAGNEVDSLAPAAMALLHDPDLQTQYVAAIVLMQLRRHDAGMIERWLDLIKVGGPRAAVVAASALGEIIASGDHRPVEGMLELLPAAGGNVRGQILYSLARTRDPRIARLIAAEIPDDASDPNSPPLGLDQVLRSIGAMGEAGGPAVPRLARLLSVPSLRERTLVVIALGEIGPAAAEALPALLPGMNDWDSARRRAHIESVGRIGRADPEVIEALRSNLLSEHGTLFEREVLEAMFRVGWSPEGDAAIRVRELARSDRSEVRMWAQMVAARQNGTLKECVPDLIAWSTSTDLATSLSAIEALEALGPMSEEALPTLELLQAQPAGAGPPRDGNVVREARRAAAAIRRKLPPK